MSLRSRTVLACLVVALSGALAGCPDMPMAPDAPGMADGTAAALKAVSEQGNASWADLAVGPDGTWHAVLQEASKADGSRQVYHRASTDGGATWSATVPLSRGLDMPQAGFVRVAVDGSGRVYAIWKDATNEGDHRAGAIWNGTLVYRVLAGGAWSDPVTLGTPKEVLSWFPAVAPDGRMHVVWNETIKKPDGWHTQASEAGLIRMASLDGAAAGEAKDVLVAPPVNLPGTPVNYYDGYEGLSGYVDAAGRPHFVAEKRVARPDEYQSSDPSEIVLYDGQAERTLFPVADFDANAHFRYPPTLLRDAAGREHLVLLHRKRERHALVDYAIGQDGAPAVVYELPANEGELRGFQAFQGPSGQMAALIEAQETAAGRFDALLARFDGARWGSPSNLTNNAGRGGLDSVSTSGATDVHKLVTYSAKDGAVAFGPSGLGVLLVNLAIETYMRETTLGSTSSSISGSGSSTHVYFTQMAQ